MKLLILITQNVCSMSVCFTQNALCLKIDGRLSSEAGARAVSTERNYWCIKLSINLTLLIHITLHVHHWVFTPLPVVQGKMRIKAKYMTFCPISAIHWKCLGLLYDLPERNQISVLIDRKVCSKLGSVLFTKKLLKTKPSILKSDLYLFSRS